MNEASTEARVLRPVPYFVWVATGALGLALIICLAVAIAFFLARQVFGVFWLALALGSGYLLLEIRQARLCADASMIDLRVLFQRAHCLRSEIVRMRVGRPVPRSGSPCEFLRGDGSVAFRTPIATWGRSSLTGLAQYLGLPFDDAASLAE